MSNQMSLSGNYGSLNKLLDDVETISDALGDKLVRVGLFGSCSYDSIDTANDIDLALFVRKSRFKEIKEELLALRLNYGVSTDKISSSYGGSIFNSSQAQKNYDIVVLDADNPNRDFIELSEPTMQMLHRSTLA